MKLNPESFARASSRHPWRTVMVWVLLLVGGFALSSRLLEGALTTEFDFTNSPESKRAAVLVEERLRGPDKVTELVILTSESATVDDEVYSAFVTGLQENLQAVAGGTAVEGTVSYLQAPEASPVSDDRGSTIVTVFLRGDLDQASEHVEELNAVLREAEADSGFRILVVGDATTSAEFELIAEEDIKTGEGFGGVVAIIVLILVLGAVVAAALPMVLAVVAIGVALGATALVGQLFELTFFIQNIIFMMGLAVGIDYALFIVSRYREERVRGREKLEAIGKAGGTASRAVFFSGMTVVLALVGMFLIPTTIFRSLAVGAILVVLSAVAASMTLLPAVLALLGDRVNKLRVPLIHGRARGDAERIGGFWDWATKTVMRRPLVSLVIGAGILVAAALPYFSINTGIGGISTLPDDIQAKKAFQVLTGEFSSGGLGEPAEIVIDGDVASSAVQAAVTRLKGTIAGDPAFGLTAPLEVNEAGDLAVLSVALSGDVSSEASIEAIRRLRSDYIPQAFEGVGVEVLVGGETAFDSDFFDVADTYTPIVFVFVLGLSFLLLTVVFRSLVVPVKAIIMNLLSVGAAYGMVVMFFQQGVGPSFIKDIADGFGFIQVEAIEAWLPLFLFSILFGLSMDYHVFLLSRIRERFDQTGDNSAAVAYGLRTTGSIITGAALIMVAVFAGFAAGRLVGIQQVGFGLGVAVFLDATVVRSVLVPSTMKLLGDRNWYLPKWLEWLPKVDVEGHEAAGAGRLPELPVAVSADAPH